MSFVQDLNTRRKHRGMTPWELVKMIGRLERDIDAKDRAADSLACQLVQLATEIDGLQRQKTDLEGSLDTAAIDYSGALDDMRIRDARIAELEAELAPYRAAEANANAVDVPPMERDTTAVEDQATAPAGVDVTTLREAAADGRLGFEATTTGTSPAHVPTWARDTDTRPLRTIPEAS